MQLNKLEVKGFKSFGDKITIRFDEGITGIVGPNGCGKSNVVDALRWVLGEQKTRALRSEKMEDVIFNGTKDRKPHQMAEVSVTFNNTRNLLPTDYSQITITRRYYRTGDSEYELNSVSCRLKDITDLFLDTGVGPDSYAIIELKMVENLLNDKDGSRREMFEEAAGISKFKIRKRQTMRKLEDTDKDLARVEDLLFEIEKNLKLLEKQAKQAEKYFEIKEEYKKQSIELAKRTVENRKKEFDELQKYIDKENDHKVSLTSRIAQTEAALDKLKLGLIAKENLVKLRQKTLNEQVNKLRAYEGEKKIKNERLRFLTEQSVKLSQQVLSDKQSNERSEHSIKSLTEENALLSKQVSLLEQKVKTLQEEYEQEKISAGELQNRWNDLNARLRKRQETVYAIGKSLEINQVQVTVLRQELDKSASETTLHASELEGFEEKITQLESLLNIRQAEYDDILKKEDEQLTEARKLNDELAILKEKTVELNRRLDAKTNEFNLTKSLVENLEGFPDAVRFLKKNSNWVKDAPLLSDILTCDEKNRISIENYLEPFMNYFVVDTREQAIQAVNLLSDSAKGKANFFILSHFAGFKPLSHKMIDGAKPAIEVVEYDVKYKNLVQYLLHDVYIQFEHQDKIEDREGIVLITQNGKFIRRQHSISGGSVGLFEGKRIGRAKNLEFLEKEIRRVTDEISTFQQQIVEKQQILNGLKASTHKEEIENRSDTLHQLKRELVAYQTRREQLSGMLSRNSGRQEEVFSSIYRMEKEIAESKPRLEAEKATLLEEEKEAFVLKETLDEQNKRLSERSAQYNQENIAFYQLRNKQQSISQELDFKKSSFESTKASIEKNVEELKKVETDIKALLESPDMNDDELNGMYREKEEIEKGVNEAEKDYYAGRAEIEELDKIIRETGRQREQSDMLLAELGAKMNENKLKLTAITERLSIEFNIALQEVMEDGPLSEINEEELKAGVELLKSKIEKMGPVNPMAMEAYKEIEERHRLIMDQRKDIADAKSSLLETITEIDTTAREHFMDAFEKIKDNFKKVFRSLFTEDDNCDITLSHPDDPLESSIDIIAKPKGKRPQSINQLSGGEKTLTAISLLFAIYLIKPAPFCVFDEVDAPLDDANIDKFNNIIRKFSDESQFIIVTHNKRTMASTDIMYGVTMVETGISRVVPVDLRSLTPEEV